MADATNIEWADSTFNPWMGCTKISPACDHCYAEELMDKRMGKVRWGAGQPRVRTSAANWRKPLVWNSRPFCECQSCGWRGEQRDTKTFDEKWQEGHWCPECGNDRVRSVRRRVFCASLADVFDNEVNPAWRRDLFDLIEQTPNLDWLLLTKRIGNAARMIEGTNFPGHRAWPWPNVWLGATICNQEEADRDIPKLLKVPAAVRFLSVEPLLGPVTIYHDWLFEHRAVTKPAIDWVIVGGESGPNARPMHPAWARSLSDQCAAAGVPFLFKQWGEFRHRDAAEDTRNDAPGSLLYVPEHDATYARVGKKAAGRLLDGREHNGYPEAP